MTGQTASHREITVQQLAALIDTGTAEVVDVREAEEFAAGHVPGARNMPLSTFDPAALPDAPGKTVVLNCQGGKRSAMALDKCAMARSAVNTHLAGGFGAWAESGMPVQRA